MSMMIGCKVRHQEEHGADYSDWKNMVQTTMTVYKCWNEVRVYAC